LLLASPGLAVTFPTSPGLFDARFALAIELKGITLLVLLPLPANIPAPNVAPVFATPPTPLASELAPLNTGVASLDSTCGSIIVSFVYPLSFLDDRLAYLHILPSPMEPNFRSLLNCIYALALIES
jgi:hypothetical protein